MPQVRFLIFLRLKFIYYFNNNYSNISSSGMTIRLLFFLSLIAVFSCSKSRCPQPVLSDGSSSSNTVNKTINNTGTGILTITVINADTLYTLTMQPDSDGIYTIINELQPTASYGQYPYLVAEAWTQNSDTSIQRSLIDFDYSSIPSGATITSAILTLYADTSHEYSISGHLIYPNLTNTNNWYLSQVTSAWSMYIVNWNSQPSINTATRLTEPASTSPSEAYTIDVTNFVKQEIANPTAYYGFMLSLVSEEPSRAVYFYSCDGPYANLHPKMVIKYTK